MHRGTLKRFLNNSSKLAWRLATSLLIGTALTAGACGEEPADTRSRSGDTDTTPPCTDADQDGYPVQSATCETGPFDCDDTTADRAPGLAEACDGIDNNCDDVTDEGCDCTAGDTQLCGSEVGECARGLPL